MSKVFGIDLGTTYSCISYIDEYGKAVVLKNSDGEHTTPSVVMVESDTNIIVGNEAKRSIEIDPDKTVQFIKRKMGKEEDTVLLNGKEYHAPEVSAWILKKLVNDANEELKQTGIISDGEEIKDVVITCPAYFGMNERQATKTAGELAGLNVINIINEPTAAAISYGVSGQERNETVLVYDLGGGTFDITVMNINKNEISVVCTGGDDVLGGKNWDEALMDYIVERYEEEMGESLAEDPEIIASLYVDVETWKKSLTSREKVNITVNGPAGRFKEELTREKYEEITSNLLNRTKNLLEDVLATSKNQGYPMDKIEKILLVGGSSRMPQVSAMLERDYNVKPVLADPDEAVAKGAAIYASNEKAFNDFVYEEAKKSGKTVEEVQNENLINGELDKKFALSTAGASSSISKISISNVLSRTYGLECLNEHKKLIISNMLMINDTLPAKYTQTFYASVNNQRSCELAIYESRSTEENMDIEDRKPLTTITMTFLSPVPKGTEIVTTMALDNAGIMHIIATEELNGSSLDTTFELSNQMNESEIEEANSRMLNMKVE